MTFVRYDMGKYFGKHIKGYFEVKWLGKIITAYEVPIHKRHRKTSLSTMTNLQNNSGLKLWISIQEATGSKATTRRLSSVKNSSNMIQVCGVCAPLGLNHLLYRYPQWDICCSRRPHLHYQIGRNHPGDVVWSATNIIGSAWDVSSQFPSFQNKFLKVVTSLVFMLEIWWHFHIGEPLYDIKHKLWHTMRNATSVKKKIRYIQNTNIFSNKPSQFSLICPRKSQAVVTFSTMISNRVTSFSLKTAKSDYNVWTVQ